MEKLKQLLGAERYAKYFKYHKAEDFDNWGRGVMHKNERQALLDKGAIKTFNGTDYIACDGWCVNVYERGEPKCVYEGNRWSCEQEAQKIRNQRATAKVEIKSYPKSYVEYLKSKSFQGTREQIELQTIAESFGGEVLPDF